MPDVAAHGARRRPTQQRDRRHRERLDRRLARDARRGVPRGARRRPRRRTSASPARRSCRSPRPAASGCSSSTTTRPSRPAAIATLLAEARRHDDVGALAAQMRFADRPQVVNSAGLEIDRLGIAFDLGDRRAGRRTADRAARGVRHVRAAPRCIAARCSSRSAASTRSFFMYLEDVDVAWRARAHGWRACSCRPPSCCTSTRAAPGTARTSSTSTSGETACACWRRTRRPRTSLRYWPLIVAYDLAYVAYALAVDRSTAPLRGRLRGCASGGATARAGAPAARRRRWRRAARPARRRCAATPRSAPGRSAADGQSIDAVFLTWNSREQALECVAHTRDPELVASIVVVDNASSDGTADAVRAAHPDVTVIALEQGVGLAEALNMGARLGSRAVRAVPQRRRLRRARARSARCSRRSRRRPTPSPPAGASSSRTSRRRTSTARGRFPAGDRRRAAVRPRAAVAAQPVDRRAPARQARRPHDRRGRPAGGRLPARAPGGRRADRRLGRALLVLVRGRRLLAPPRRHGVSLYVPTAPFRHVGGATARRLKAPAGHARYFYGVLQYARTHYSRAGRATSRRRCSRSASGAPRCGRRATAPGARIYLGAARGAIALRARPRDQALLTDRRHRGATSAPRARLRIRRA